MARYIAWRYIIRFFFTIIITFKKENTNKDLNCRYRFGDSWFHFPCRQPKLDQGIFSTNQAIFLFIMRRTIRDWDIIFCNQMESYDTSTQCLKELDLTQVPDAARTRTLRTGPQCPAPRRPLRTEYLPPVHLSYGMPCLRLSNPPQITRPFADSSRLASLQNISDFSHCELTTANFNLRLLPFFSF